MNKTTSPEDPTMQQAAERHPERRHGGPVYPATVTKWIRYGVKITGGATVHLKGVRLPSGRRTTGAWFDELLDKLTRASLEETRRPKADPAHDAIRRFEIEPAEKELAEMGL